jgi:hypothetical protein
MARKTPFTNVTLRIDQDLHGRLRKAADLRHGTLNSEVKWRLQRTFDDDRVRSLDRAAQDIEIVTYRLAKLFSDREIAMSVVEAVLAGDFERARVLALVLRKGATQ